MHPSYQATDLNQIFDTHAYDIVYELIDGPHAGALVCVAADLDCEGTQIRIRRGDVEHVYHGTTHSNQLEYLADPRHLGFAWRPIRWILIDGRTYIFSDDHPVLPSEVAR